jgi:hypothetical protein
MRHRSFVDPSPSMRAMILLTGLFLTPDLSAGHGAQLHHVRSEGRPHRLRASGRNLQRHCGSNLWVEYPRSEKTQLDPLIAHMAKTLIGSNACWAPG